MAIEIEATGDMARLIREINRSAMEIEKLKQRLREVKSEGKSAGDSAEDAFGRKMVTAAKSFATALIGAGGVATGLRLVKEEIGAIIDLQREMGDAQVRTASAAQDMVRNMSGMSRQHIEMARRASEQIAKDTGVAQDHVFRSMASALSASGQNLPLSIAAVRQSSRFLADRPEAIPGFAGSLIDLSKVTGTQDALINQGFLQQVGALSRVVEPAQQAKNIPRALIGAQAFGATAQEGAALFAALTSAGGDITGETTATGTVSLAEQLRSFFRDQGALGKEKRGKTEASIGEALSARMGRDLTTGERIGFLQQNAAFRERFLAESSFEKTVAGPVEQLLSDPTSYAAQQFRANMGKLGGPAQWGAMARQSLADRMLIPQEPVAGMQRTLAAMADENLQRDQAGALTGVTRGGLQDVLRTAGVGWIPRQMSRAAFNWRTLGRGEDPGSAAGDILEAHASRLTDPNRGAPGMRFAPSEENKAIADRLIEIRDELRAQTRSMDVRVNRGREAVAGANAVE